MFSFDICGSLHGGAEQRRNLQTHIHRTIQDKKWGIFPYAINNGHWVLITVSPNGNLTLMDSMQSGNIGENSVKRILGDQISKMRGIKSFQGFGLNTQNDGYNCGLHTMITAEKVVKLLLQSSLGNQGDKDNLFDLYQNYQEGRGEISQSNNFKTALQTANSRATNALLQTVLSDRNHDLFQKPTDDQLLEERKKIAKQEIKVEFKLLSEQRNVGAVVAKLTKEDFNQKLQALKNTASASVPASTTADPKLPVATPNSKLQPKPPATKLTESHEKTFFASNKDLLAKQGETKDNHAKRVNESPAVKEAINPEFQYGSGVELELVFNENDEVIGFTVTKFLEGSTAEKDSNLKTSETLYLKGKPIQKEGDKDFTSNGRIQNETLKNLVMNLRNGDFSELKKLDGSDLTSPGIAKTKPILHGKCTSFEKVQAASLEIAKTA